MRFPINNEFKKCIIEKVGPQLIFYVNPIFFIFFTLVCLLTLLSLKNLTKIGPQFSPGRAKKSFKKKEEEMGQKKTQCLVHSVLYEDKVQFCKVKFPMFFRILLIVKKCF